MKKAVVTGANGFIGSSLVKELIKNNVSVIALDIPGCNNRLPDSPLITFIAMDIKNISQLYDYGIEADTFYHFAWTGSYGPSRMDISLHLQNAQWTIDCIRVAKKIGCDRFLPAGSIMEYETISATYTQGNRPGMGYIYGGGKLVAHTMAMSVAADIGINLVSPKITNAYGAGEISPRFINSTIRKILKNEDLQFTAGTQNYDFVYIDDVVRALYLIGKNGKPFHQYLIGSSTARPLREFILEMKESIASEKNFVFGDIPFTGIDLPIEQFDCSLTENDTGFRAKISFAEGVRHTMDWLKKVDK